jgi:hypothetical protein
MRIKALTSFACKEVAPSPGQVVDCSDDLALELIAAKYAVRVDEARKVEAVATSQQDEPAKPTIDKAETKQTKKEETKNDNKSGDKKRAVSTAKGKRSSSK